MSDPLVVVARLADIFDGLGIPYFVGGSLASSMHGVPRATNDADLAAFVKRIHVEALVQALETDFYVISDQQWKDIQGVFKVQGTSLDSDYLEQSAKILNIRDLLARAMESSS